VAQETLEVQVAYLRGKVEEHSQGYADIREAIQRLTERVTFLDQKVDRFRDELSGRIEALDQRLSGRIDALDQKVSRQFLWLVGVQVAVLLAVIGALLRG
jgi:archaellum component FlaC